MSQFQDSSEITPAYSLQEVLHPDVYVELRRLAATHMKSQRKDATLQTTVLVNEAWLRLSKNGRKWRDRHHFFATASMAMRQILIDRARRKSSLRNGGSRRPITSFPLHSLAAPDHSDIILLIDEGITELEKINPERARVVVDRFFGGLTVPEIAEALGLSERSVARHWAMAKVWLQKWVEEAPRSVKPNVA